MGGCVVSQYKADHVYLHGYMRFESLGYSTPITLPPDGVLEIGAGQAALICLAGGQTLRGIRITHPGGAAMSDEWHDDDAVMIMLRAEDGGVVAVNNNDATVATLDERISVDDGADTVLDAKIIQAFSIVLPGVGRRWRVHDWAGV